MKTRTRGFLAALIVPLLPVVVLVPSNKAPVARISPGPLNRLSRQDAAGKIAPQVLAETADGTSASVVVFLADQADVNAANDMKDQDARGWYVYDTLTQHAERTQAGLRSFLDSRGVGYQSYWAANMLIVSGNQSLVEQLAARDDVARIDSNRPARWIEDPVAASSSAGSSSPDVVEWGVQNVNAPAVWAMGFTGQGMVIAGQDTGIRWTHLALKNHYRGWNGSTADHNYNWHDAIHSGGGACGADSPFPCDDFFHGTHTIGSASGDDGAGNQIGVAPGAKWIGCRNMDQGNGTPATYTECFQFIIAPTDLSGQNPNPALRPHVVNNSWGCPAAEGCTTRAELETIVNNTEAAGIFVAAVAGNGGPACSTVDFPPAIYSAAFTTGAIDINNALAAFSGRGPSTYSTPNLLKPEISAPGVSVRSSDFTSDTAYTTASGTSMAGPHVAGVVALLWSARPQMVRDIASATTILKNTANPGVTVNPAQNCGGTPSSATPNNSFGYGRVDALAAVTAVPSVTGPVVVASSDLDGDGAADKAVFRPGTGTFGTWYVKKSNGSGDLAVQWGASGDIPVAGNYAGDARADFAIFRPSNGTWWVRSAEGVSQPPVQWSAFGDVAVPGQYGGDTRTDFAVWRPSNGTWYVRTAEGTMPPSVQWGTAGDIPVPGDYDGDGVTDMAVFRPSNGTWYVRFSGGGTAAIGWGASGDIPVAADFTGDGRSDYGIYRSSTGTWYVKSSATLTELPAVAWGAFGDVPLPAQMAGASRADNVVWRPSDGSWYVRSAEGLLPPAVPWGTLGDIPLAR